MKAAEARVISRDALQAQQLAQLRSLLSTVLARNPFYSSRLSSVGLTEDLTDLAEFVEKVPFTYRSDLAEDQRKNPPYGSNLTYPLAAYTRFNQTSGTTGSPMRWLDTRESWEWMIGCWTRVYESAGVGPTDRVFFPFSFGPFLGFWIAFEAATRVGCLAVSGGGMRSAARLAMILENDVTVLCSTPSYAVHLAEVARAEGLDLRSTKVRRIIVAGEPGGSIPATRGLIEKLWPGARVVDHHGMTEIGPVSYECPARPGTLHLIESAFIAEVIDPESLLPMGPGGTGELVLTNLGRVGSPLLRYRTGDIVRLAGEVPCVCGSFELALEGGILARSDGVVIVRGVNVYPTAVEEILRSCGVLEFRVETYTESALTQLRIEIEPLTEHEDASRLTDRVATALRNALGLRVMVACVPCGALPRSEGKSQRWYRR
jgi:phenylacetate-CoA ligase